MEVLRARMLGEGRLEVSRRILELVAMRALVATEA